MFKYKLLFAVLWAGAVASSGAQVSSKAIEPTGSARAANALGEYQALRGAHPAGEALAVTDFTLTREGGAFHFEQGTFVLYGPVDGRVTGAVFSGKGQFSLTPNDKSEQRSLALLTRSSGGMAQEFTSLVLRFTDGTADEIRAAGKAGGDANALGAATKASVALAESYRSKLHENLDLRVLEDLLGSAADKPAGGFFLASFRMGGFFSGKNVLFIVDPQGAPHAAPDQVELATWDDEGVQTWAAYRMDGPGKAAATSLVRVSDEVLDVSFEKSGKMICTAETTLTVARNGLRLVRLDLYPTLRVSGVFSESGQPLDFVQEAREADPDFALVLPQPAKAGETVRVLTRYAGSDALRRDGGDMYYLQGGARDRWYPTNAAEFGEFKMFHMTFHFPKGLQIVATGKQLSETSEAGGTRAVWANDTPIPVAGFNLGNFKSGDVKTPQGFDVTAYANVNLPDDLQPFVQRINMGTLSTVPAIKDELSQGSAAIQIYSNYFGRLPYDHIALTQQSACNYGQSWPMLVYLPMCAFWDDTIKNHLSLLDHGAASYWDIVTPHEVAHQWWGHQVGFNSYRDQWMSEGFAQFSVSLYKLYTSPKMDDYRAFWELQRRTLLEKDAEGKRPIDVGPLTMGYRVANDKVGNVYQALIYSKGAYVLHMLEMMYWTPQEKDQPFKHSLQEFVKQYHGKAATTEDFEHSFEGTMPKWADIEHNGKLDWFFDEWVYGTELPHYDVASDFSNTDGETTGHFKVTQANVSKSFLMVVPLYLQMENGQTVRIANLTMRGEDTADHTVKLGKLPSPPKKFLVNYNSDVLSD